MCYLSSPQQQQQGPLVKEYSQVTTPVLGLRSPLKDIANHPSEARTVKREKIRAVYPRHEFDSQLDQDERSWRDRTEVITRLDHDAYQMFAQEVISDAVSKVEESIKIKLPVKKPIHRGVAKFREIATASLADSESEYESAEELDEFDGPSAQKILSPVLPVANSTLLNIVSSANSTPNRSDTVFENSFIHSFEKMKIIENDEPVAEEKFHDASDSFVEDVALSPPGNSVPEAVDVEHQLATSLKKGLENILDHNELCTTNEVKSLSSSSTKEKLTAAPHFFPENAEDESPTCQQQLLVEEVLRDVAVPEVVEEEVAAAAPKVVEEAAAAPEVVAEAVAILEVVEEAAPEVVAEAAAAAPKVVEETAAATPEVVAEAAAAAPEVVEETTAAAPEVVVEAAAAAPKVVEETTAAAPEVVAEAAAAAPEVVEETAAAAPEVVEETAAAAPEVVEETAAAAPEVVEEEAAAAAAPEVVEETAAAAPEVVEETAAAAPEVVEEEAAAAAAPEVVAAAAAAPEVVEEEAAAAAAPKVVVVEEAAAAPEVVVLEEAAAAPEVVVLEEAAAAPEVVVVEEAAAAPEVVVVEEAAAAPEVVVVKEAAAAPEVVVVKEAAAAPEVVVEAAAAPEVMVEAAAAAPEVVVEAAAAAPEVVVVEAAAAPEVVVEAAAAAPEVVEEEEAAAAAPEVVVEEEAAAAAAPEVVVEEEAAAGAAAAPEVVVEEEAAAAAAPEVVVEEEAAAAAAPEVVVEEEEAAAAPEVVVEEEEAAATTEVVEEEEEAAAPEVVKAAVVTKDSRYSSETEVKAYVPDLKVGAPDLKPPVQGVDKSVVELMEESVPKCIDESKPLLKGCEIDFLNMSNSDFDLCNIKSLDNLSNEKESTCSSQVDAKEDIPLKIPIMLNPECRGISDELSEKMKVGNVDLPLRGNSQTDFLDMDVNFDPFKSRSIVTNSPDKLLMNEREMAKPLQYVGDGIHSQEIKYFDNLSTENDIIKTNDNEQAVCARTAAEELINKAVAKRDSLPENEFEEAVKNETFHQSFQGDFSNMTNDDFATKSTIANSELQRNEINVTKTEVQRESVGTGVAPGNFELSPAPSEVVSTELEDLRQNQMDMDFLDKLGESNFDPFATRAAVANSPDVMNSTVVIRKEMPSKKLVTLLTPENVGTLPLTSESVEPLDNSPNKKYQLNILDKLDDPNFDPFATKAAVANSPVKQAQALFTEKEKPNQNKEDISERKVTSLELSGDIITGLEKECPFENDNNLRSLTKLDDPNLNFSTNCHKLNSTVVFENERDEASLESLTEQNGKTLQFDQGCNEDIVKKFGNSSINVMAPKAAVLNSPDKDDNTVKNVTDMPSKKENTRVTFEDSVASLEKGIAMSLENRFLPQNETLEEFISKSSNSNLNPFTTNSRVQNSPTKKDSFPNSKHTTEEIRSELPSEAVHNKSEESNKIAMSSVFQENSRMECLKKQEAQEFNSSATEKVIPSIKKSFGMREAGDSFGDYFGFGKTKESVFRNSSQGRGGQGKQTSADSLNERDVFSPLHRGRARKPENVEEFNFEEFTSAAELPSDEQEYIEEEVFGSPLCYPLFNNPEDLDVLGSHGTEGDKLNLVRNSLYVKFDPLVSGRQSLAPFLAQHLKESNNEVLDPRRCSGLISFSPSPKKQQRCTDHTGTPVKALFVSVGDETLALDATSLENTVVNDGGNTTVVSSNQTLNNTTISTTITDANETVLHVPVINTQRMYTERELKDKLKNMELIMQDTMLRKSREFEDVQKRLNRELMEQDIAMSGLEEENFSLRSSIKQMQDVMAKILQHEATKEKEHKNQLLLLENQYELKLTALQKECEQCKDEMKKAEVPLFDMVKKFERLREVSERLWKNEEILKSKNESLETKLAQKEETFKKIIKVVEEKYDKAQEEYTSTKHTHEQEIKKASLMLRKAELKILTLTETVEKTTTENQRLKDLIEDITKSLDGN
ncbi:LOW QUALITY PROTEIN: titin homolog [Procambarus clarkii]|uniref:LOW QUALITY PROTEIN: titin homolog n=1 Tax=Procambarus clarkii TaxID=6728 RepID=UPI0037449A92